jgi:hypothetical protein
MHLETITYNATQPNTGLAAAAVTGDSLTIKNSKARAQILQGWGMNQVEGFQQITFPSGHDTTRGFRANVDALMPQNFFTNGLGMYVEPQELLSILIAGSNVAADVESGSLLIKYDDLPGVTSRTISWQALRNKVESLTTISATLTGAAAGYTGSELINAESDLLRANRDYAVLGLTTNIPCCTLSILGPDTGYQRVSLPGPVDTSQMLQEGFVFLARSFDEPLIPVINSGNRNSTFLSFVQNENNISPLVTAYLALLK